MPRVAFFRPDDERAQRADGILSSLGADPVSDPLLKIEPTGALPRTDAEYVILTSRTGVNLLDEADYTLNETSITCAIGDATARAMEEVGLSVDIIPEAFTSAGLVDRLASQVPGATVEIARSDHGSQELITGLFEAGAYVHETVLYRLIRPPKSGRSTELLVAGDLDALLFTSSLTVEHFLDAARDRGIESEVREAFDEVVVGVIGPPTEETAERFGVPVNVVARKASFETLAREVLDQTARP